MMFNVDSLAYMFKAHHQAKKIKSTIMTKSIRKDGIANSNPLNPSAGVLIKLGSLLVHYEELLSGDGHEFDKIAIDSLIKDEDVVQWRNKMNALALLPVKRKP